ncbi:MAG: VCBS repeat-containing protein [Verrucomicrobia bacterium]|nr:VCBS repeat-containing protein [Verrucomicrobiota bacterium]
MKSVRSLRAAAALALAASAVPLGNASAQLPPIAFQETAAEFSGRADLDGNGLPDVVIVDKVSGAIRIAYQTSAGVFQWDEPKASGIGDVTGVAAGRLLATTKDALAVTAPEANRINLLAPTLGGAVVPQALFINPIGPVSLAASNLNGTISADDLWIGSAFNSAPNAGSFDQFVNNPIGSLSFSLNRGVSTGYFDRTNNAVLKTSLSGTFGYMERLAASDTFRVLSPAEVGAPVRLSLAGLPAGSAWILAPFNAATYACLLTWVPGDTGFASRTVSEPVANSYALSAPATFAVGFPLGQLVVVPTSGTPRLLAISQDGATAAYFDFNGTTLSAPIETLNAPAGEQFTGAVALAAFQGFHLLRGPAGDGRTATSRYFKWSGSAGKFTDVGGQTFGLVGKRAGAGNVLVFAGEPLVSPTAKLLTRLNARDWSSGNAPVPPANLDVSGEIDRGATQGLGGSAAVALGAPPAGATNVLLNQYRPNLSFFSLSRAAGSSIGEPFISPNGGLFAKTVQLSFSAPAGMSVYYRDQGGAWTLYAPPGAQPATNPGDAAYEAWWLTFRPLLRFKNSIVEYYGQVGSQRTAIKTAKFDFSVSPDALSSLNDGVPDYVKIGLHYNPFQPPPNLDPKELGSFLNRILANLVAVPGRLNPSAVELFVCPQSLNGYSLQSAASLLAGAPQADGTPAPGNQIFAYDLGGALLAQGDNGGLQGWMVPFTDPSARLTSLSGEGNGGFTVLSSRVNFAIGGPGPAANYPSAIGRELVGLCPLPARTPSYYVRNYGGGSDIAEANAWIAGAIAFYNNSAAAVPQVAVTIDSLDSMALLVFERWLLLRCLERGFLPGSYTPPVPNAANPPATPTNYLSLTGFRAGEAARPIDATPSGAVYPTAEQLRALQVVPPPGAAYRLTDVIAAIQNTLRNSADADIAQLRAVTNDVYRISSRYANEVRGAFDPPVGALRQFLATGAVPPGYGNKPPASPLPGAPYASLTDAQYTSAIAGLGKVLAAVPARPTATLDLLVKAGGVTPSCTVVDAFPGNAGSVALVNYDGAPFAFPASISLAPGTRLTVTAYVDLPNGPCGPQVEVVDVAGVPQSEIVSIPVPTPFASSGLLPDDWQLFFFGQLGVDPFATAPGAGVSFLQIYLDGKDPQNFASYGGLPVLLSSLPQPKLFALGGGMSQLMFNLPAIYANRFQFQLQTTPDLAGGFFANTPEQFLQTLPGQFELTLPPSGGSKRFWRVGFSLK